GESIIIELQLIQLVAVRPIFGRVANNEWLPGIADSLCGYVFFGCHTLAINIDSHRPGCRITDGYDVVPLVVEQIRFRDIHFYGRLRYVVVDTENEIPVMAELRPVPEARVAEGTFMEEICIHVGCRVGIRRSLH